jgi:hypothetical protein
VVPCSSTWTGGVGGVDGVLERPGGLLGKADLSVGVAALELVDEVGDGDPVSVQRAFLNRGCWQQGCWDGAG